MGRRRANYIAMRAFGEPDAFPSSDLGLRRVLTGDRTPPSEDQFLNLRGKLAAVASLCSDILVGCRRGTFGKGRTRFYQLEKIEAAALPGPRINRRQSPFDAGARRPEEVEDIICATNHPRHRIDEIFMRGRETVFGHRLGQNRDRMQRSPISANGPQNPTKWRTHVHI